MADARLVEMLKRTVTEFAAWRDNLKEDGPHAPIDLAGADFSGCYLDGVNLFNAELVGAKFVGARLRSANLCGANLSLADFTSADLRGANLAGACVSDADFDEANLSQVQLRDVEGLETACFNGATVEPKAQRVILAAIAESMRDAK